MPTRPSNRALALSVLLSVTPALPGCWTAPRADLQPPGVPNVVVDHILVRWDADTAVVQAIDPQARTLRLVRPKRRSPGLYTVPPTVSGFERIRPRDRIRATLVDELSVRVPNSAIAAARVPPEARVLSVDPAYRLLTIKYQNGEEETFKVDLHVKLRCTHAGDAVAFRPLKLIAFKKRK